MKNVWLAVIGLAAIGYGCGPRLAETPYGQKELEWKEYVSSAYPSWTPPQTVPPVESIVPEPGQMGASSNVPSPEAQEVVPLGSSDLKPLPVLTPVDTAPSASVTPSSLPSADTVPQAPLAEAAPVAAKGPALDAALGGGSAAAPVFAPSAAVASPKAAAGSEQTYTAKKGDSLSKIAAKFYKNGNKWKVIENANKDVLGKKGLRAGMKLRIPAL